jgi:hypothetical protein
MEKKTMLNTKKQPTCKELVRDKFNQVEQDYQEASEDLFDYANSTALSWDYVEPGTFEDQEEGYYRLQLSWGGPSDEFRIYTIADTLEIDVIEYWYMDWFDGASINVMPDTLSWDVCQMFLDCEV